MNAQELFYFTGSIAFILISAFLVFLSLIVLALYKAADRSLRLIGDSARRVEDAAAGGWKAAALAGTAFRLFRIWLRRR